MGGGWVEADLRCNLSDDILMESDPHRLVFYILSTYEYSSLHPELDLEIGLFFVVFSVGSYPH